jgi:membrane-associated phospholipid phosphatase
MSKKFKIILSALLTFSSIILSYSQVASPYKTDLLKDGVWITTSLGLNAFGLSQIKNKPDLSLEDLNNLDKNDIWFVDRWAAGNFDENANNISDIPFFASFATPLLLTLNKDTRQHSGQLSVMLIESLSTASAAFTISAGFVEKSRPKVYNESVDLDERLRNNSQRSFFSGHVAASASATFFTAQVFSDFFPDSKAKPYVWTAAAIIPGVVGYYRIKSGNHFLSDVIIGYIIGGASGMLIPRMHKVKDSPVKVISGAFRNYQTLGVAYNF